MRYVRFESAVPNGRGGYAGVFGLANGLARSGRLSAVDWVWWRAANDWYEGAYPDPGTVDPTLFDRVLHPVVTCWFLDSAEHLLCRVPGYLALLDRYGVAWRERRSADPGLVRYRDEVQVVVTPYPLTVGCPMRHVGRGDQPP